MMAPRVSVLLPVYNASRFLREAVDSILRQTYRDFELLAIDDGSTDQSLATLESYRDPRLRILRNDRNRGLIYSLNRGLAEARGVYVARMDADDISQPTRLEQQAAFLDSHPKVAVVGSNVEDMDEAGRTVSVSHIPCSNEEIQHKLLRRCCMNHPSVMFRRQQVVDLGGYREAHALTEDYDLWLRVSERHELANLSDRLLRYRIHASQTCFRNQTKQYEMTQRCRLDALRRRGYSEADIRDRFAHSVWDRLTAKPSTVGFHYIGFYKQFRMLGDSKLAWQAAGHAIVHSPFAAKSWAALYEATILVCLGTRNLEKFRWYFSRLKTKLGR